MNENLKKDIYNEIYKIVKNSNFPCFDEREPIIKIKLDDSKKRANKWIDLIVETPEDMGLGGKNLFIHSNLRFQTEKDRILNLSCFDFYDGTENEAVKRFNKDIRKSDLLKELLKTII